MSCIQVSTEYFTLLLPQGKISFPTRFFFFLTEQQQQHTVTLRGSHFHLSQLFPITCFHLQALVQL